MKGLYTCLLKLFEFHAAKVYKLILLHNAQGNLNQIF